ncbi:hypothetical protein LT493_32065 [Streptomyces tricolor]|nr:hypothetical protein [Streptomyces tricolor]
MATLHVTLLIDLTTPGSTSVCGTRARPYDLPRLALSPDGDLLVTGDGDDSVQRLETSRARRPAGEAPPLPPVSPRRRHRSPRWRASCRYRRRHARRGDAGQARSAWSVRNRRALDGSTPVTRRTWAWPTR